MTVKSKKVIITDLDGCICNDSHRHHLAPATREPLSGWNAYHLACGDDAPIMGTIRTVQALAAAHRIHIITGRQEIARAHTIAWLARYNVPYDELRMYLPADVRYRKWEYKLRYIEELRERGLHPVLFIEDWPLIADHVETAGRIPVLCINSRFPKLYER